jgi:hypothetical protein
VNNPGLSAFGHLSTKDSLSVSVMLRPITSVPEKVNEVSFIFVSAFSEVLSYVSFCPSHVICDNEQDSFTHTYSSHVRSRALLLNAQLMTAFFLIKHAGGAAEVNLEAQANCQDWLEPCMSADLECCSGLQCNPDKDRCDPVRNPTGAAEVNLPEAQAKCYAVTEPCDRADQCCPGLLCDLDVNMCL